MRRAPYKGSTGARGYGESRIINYKLKARIYANLMAFLVDGKRRNMESSTSQPVQENIIKGTYKESDRCLVLSL